MKLLIKWNTPYKEPPGPDLLEFHSALLPCTHFGLDILQVVSSQFFQLASIYLNHTESGLQCHVGGRSEIRKRKVHYRK